jgi:hypothetical protein
VTGRRWLLLSLLGAAIGLLLAKGAAQVYADYLWYRSVGAAEVWRVRSLALLALRAGCGAIATLFVFANLYGVRQSVVSLVLPRRVGNLDIGEEVERRHLTWTAAAMSAVIGIVLAWPQNDWSGLVMARSGMPFGESDPYFASDLGFFVYWLPFELDMFTWTLTMVLIVIGLVLLLYALTPSLRWESGALYVSGYVRRHLAMLAGALLLVLAWHHRLEMFTALGGSSADGAFGYLDHRVRIPANLLLSLITLGAGLTVLWAGWTGQMRLAFAAMTGVLVATAAAHVVAPFVVERAIADRDAALRERPYLATRAGYTRRAFAVDRVSTADSTLAYPSLAAAAPFVPVWDPGAIASAADLYHGAAVGWTVTDTGMSAHGVTAAGVLTDFSAALAGPAGQLLQMPGSDWRGTLLVVPDSTARARLVADSGSQIAAPLLTSRWARIAHALSMQDFRIWLGELPDSNPKLVSRRAVRERVAAIAPIFAQGDAIVPVRSGGALHWAVDLYSASATYPLSQRIISAGQERAYLQHAATALVNVETGRILLVPDSAADPIAATWMRRFPVIFARPAAIPAAIRRQLPPARESARAQALALARFGLRGENSDATRGLPPDEGADSSLAATQPPVLGLPGMQATAYVLPLVDRADRLRGLFIATGGPSRQSFWLPIGDSAPAWGDGIDRLHAVDTASSIRIVRGAVRAVPVGGSVALVQPRYQWPPGGRPRLLYVGIVEGDSVRTEPLLLQVSDTRRDARPLTAADFRTRVAELYSEMRRALSRGDWTAYGRAFTELGNLLGQPRE